MAAADFGFWPHRELEVIAQVWEKEIKGMNWNLSFEKK